MFFHKPSVTTLKDKELIILQFIYFRGNLYISGEISSKTNTGPNLLSYLFQAYTSLNPSRLELNYTTHLLKMVKTNY